MVDAKDGLGRTADGEGVPGVLRILGSPDELDELRLPPTPLAAPTGSVVGSDHYRAVGLVESRSRPQPALDVRSKT